MLKKEKKWKRTTVISVFSQTNGGMEEGYCTYTALNDNGIVNRNSKSFEIRHRSEMNRDVFSKAFDRTCQNIFDRLTQKKNFIKPFGNRSVRKRTQLFTTSYYFIIYVKINQTHYVYNMHPCTTKCFRILTTAKKRCTHVSISMIRFIQ